MSWSSKEEIDAWLGKGKKREPFVAQVRVHTITFDDAGMGQKTLKIEGVCDPRDVRGDYCRAEDLTVHSADVTCADHGEVAQLKSEVARLQGELSAARLAARSTPKGELEEERDRLKRRLAASNEEFAALQIECDRLRVAARRAGGGVEYVDAATGEKLNVTRGEWGDVTQHARMLAAAGAARGSVDAALALASLEQAFEEPREAVSIAQGDDFAVETEAAD